MQKFGIQNIQKINVLKIQIRSAQNVGRVWISREKILLVPFGAISRIFPWTDKNVKHVYILLIFVGGPMRPIHAVWGHVLVS